MSTDNSRTNKPCIVVTGATGYFGGYFVEALAQDYHVLAMARNLEKLEAMQQRLGDNVTPVCCDLSDLEQARTSMRYIMREYNVVGLVNNAFPLGKATGFNTPDGALDKITTDMMLNAFSAGAVAPMVLIQEFGNALMERKATGKIVNISSMYASVSPDPVLYEGKTTFNPVSYGMTKAALEYLTKYVASFWGAKGIRCNAIAPGPFPNVEFDSENATRDNQFLDRLRAKNCNHEVGHPTQLLGALRLLLSDDAEFINGEVIRVDGGWTVR
ncbi:SDR family oxidoreductase [Paraneptunicella aestuarii]|uniref:SDR family NAD(P)-dependent oxidoreductase n=1 Tax=Paraneptunicella aestuarii TaxID=2831148 RepID=UPI001E61F0D1|nr:SDR family oxidoreductase [Paraneptunicella aestuarii]UAA39543.1 SDR family oxidoreductase [Paraneptunicella aestuarii]